MLQTSSGADQSYNIIHPQPGIAVRDDRLATPAYREYNNIMRQAQIP